MELHFSKEPNVDHMNEYYNVYSLFVNESLLGKFYYSSKKCSFSFEKISVRIDTTHRFFRKPKVMITDNTSNTVWGHYELTNWTIFIGYRHKLHLHDEIHSFKRHIPDRYSLFDKTTWGRYKFTLTNNTEQITYTFQIRYPLFSLGNIGPSMPFEGSIKFNSNNKLALFAGLYLIETALENLSD